MTHGTERATVSLNDNPPARTLSLAEVANFRDTGGYRTMDGRRVATGRLFRSGVLGLPGSGAKVEWDRNRAAQCRALGLRTVVDLRSEREAQLVPTAWATETGARLVHAPVLEGCEGSDTNFARMLQDGTITRFSEGDLGQWYQGALRRRAAAFGAAVGALSKPDALPALVHCHAGKDRTGLLVAVVLAALDVPDDDIVADYTLTNAFPDQTCQWAAELADLGIEPEDVKVFWQVPAGAMRSVLAFLAGTYGGAVGYLTTACAVTQTEVEFIRQNLLKDDE